MNDDDDVCLYAYAWNCGVHIDCEGLELISVTASLIHISLDTPMVLVLPPSEYTGEPNTAVGGRVVLRRKYVLRSDSTKGKGKGKGKKGKTESNNNKCEVHLLGGKGVSEVLFIEAWGNGADALFALAEQGKLVKIQNAKIVPQRPQYSTSKLQYFLRMQNPGGAASLVLELTSEGRWAEIPMHHPFVDVAAMRKVPENLQCCVLARIAHQPGAQLRQSMYGEGLVCNAIMRVKEATIRASFWRAAAETLANYAVGSNVALYQVTVKKVGTDDWELRANQSTRIDGCPTDLEESLMQSTNLETEATESLTQVHEIDYATVISNPSNVGSLAALLLPGHVRDLNGVFEVHNVTALGVSSVLYDGNFSMQSCSKCKKQVDFHTGQCRNPAHANEQIIPRWIAKVTLHDANGSADAIIFHDALVSSQIFQGLAEPLTDIQVVTLQRKVRNALWSARIIYKANEEKQQNELEVKLMLPTFTIDGVLASWSIPLVPEVFTGATIPFASCAEVLHDEDLGTTSVKDKEITAARLFINILPEETDEETAEPDTATGLRVTRRFMCAADKEDKEIYKLTVAGLSSSVQWLLKAADNSVWMVLAIKRGREKKFVPTGYLNVTTFPDKFITAFVTKIYNRPAGPLLTMVAKDTPCKRRKIIDDAMPSLPEQQPTFDMRIAWADLP
jgi:hypothetical protein